jgi:nitroreductase
MTIAPLEDTLARRWSCRAFTDRPVPDAQITRIVTAAQKSPSWGNVQPWQLVVTQGAATDRFRDALYAHAGQTPANPDLDWPTGYPGIYGDRRRTCGWQLYDAVGVQKGDRAASGKQMMENFRLFGAPHVAILHSPKELGSYGAMDCGGFVTAFCLAATALGVATIAQAAIAGYPDFVRDHFDLPQDRLILCAISFGYADESHPANSYRTDRADARDVIDWRA